MFARPDNQGRTFESLRLLGCWLLALVVFVQSLWLPFHLASERHLAPGEQPTQCVTPADADSRCAWLRDNGDDGPLRRLHLGLEHKSAKDSRVDDDAVAPPDLDESALAASFQLPLDVPTARSATPQESQRCESQRFSASAPRAPPFA